MNILAIAIIFGLVYPVYCWIANFCLGSQSEERKEVLNLWIEDHPILSIMGLVMSYARPVVYWVIVLVFLVL